MGKPASEKPRTIQEAMTAYEKRIEELELEKAMLEEENETLRARVENFASAGASTGDAVLMRGQERDLYPGEIREVVLDVLHRVGEDCRQGSRRAEILRDIVKSNAFADEPRRRAQELKTILQGYSGMNSAVRKKLHDLGIDADAKVSKHIKVSYYGDPRYAATLASSGSDSRCGGKNLASDLIQRFF